MYQALVKTVLHLCNRSHSNVKTLNCNYKIELIGYGSTFCHLLNNSLAKINKVIVNIFLLLCRTKCVSEEGAHHLWCSTEHCLCPKMLYVLWGFTHIMTLLLVVCFYISIHVLFLFLPFCEKSSRPQHDVCQNFAHYASVKVSKSSFFNRSALWGECEKIWQEVISTDIFLSGVYGLDPARHEHSVRECTGYGLSAVGGVI